MQVQLVSTNGATTLSTLTGLSFTVGDGTADATMTFTGTVAAVNTALTGLSFNPTTGFTGAASLQIVTSDQGNTGTGGTLTDNDTVAITVTSGPSCATELVTNGGFENGATGPGLEPVGRRDQHWYRGSPHWLLEGIAWRLKGDKRDRDADRDDPGRLRREPDVLPASHHGRVRSAVRLLQRPGRRRDRGDHLRRHRRGRVVCAAHA